MKLQRLLDSSRLKFKDWRRESKERLAVLKRQAKAEYSLLNRDDRDGGCVWCRRLGCVHSAIALQCAFGEQRVGAHGHLSIETVDQIGRWSARGWWGQEKISLSIEDADRKRGWGFGGEWAQVKGNPMIEGVEIVKGIVMMSDKLVQKLVCNLSLWSSGGRA